MASVAAPAPNLQCQTFYGLRTDIKKNAWFLSDDELLYPAGHMIIIQNQITRRQRFIKRDPIKIIKSMVLAPNCRWLALDEIAPEGQTAMITVYDMNTFKRRKEIQLPHSDDFPPPQAREIAAMQFTFDSKFLMIISGEPDWVLYQMNWDKLKLESCTRAKNPDGRGTVDSVQCNPADNTLICVTGPYTFRIMNVLECSWRQWGWSKADKLIISTCMWLTPDRIMIGTANQLIMMIENGDLRGNCIFDAVNTTEMALKKGDEIEGASDSTEKMLQGTPLEEGVESYPVRLFNNFTKGFLYTCGPGMVYLFEKESSYFYTRKGVYRICKLSYKHTREDPMWTELDAVRHLIVSPNEETVILTTLRKQCYYIKIFQPVSELTQIKEDEVIPFEELGPSMHFGPVNSLSICAWKPIFMTAGEQDRSVRLWNYVTETVEMVKIYQEEIHTVSLHPTGLFAIIGFSDKLRFMVILIDDLEVMREFPIRNCKRARFSTNGHLFAAVNSQVIQIFSSVSFQNIYNLKGHNGKITSLAWSANDLILVSCGAEGAVYEWSMSTGQRVGEIIRKSNPFNACAVNSTGTITYAAGNDGEIKQISNSAVRTKLMVLEGQPLYTMVMSRSSLMLFTSGGEGTVITITLPILEQNNQTLDYLWHCKKVMCLGLTYDDQMLITVADDSSIALWKLLNPHGRAIALDPEFAHAKEILISRKDLQDKLNSISLLSTRMSELETEHTYQLRQAEASQAEKLKEIHDGYCQAIEELKDKNENMENEHGHEIGSIQQDIVKLKNSHEKTLQEMEADFNIRLISEYDRYESLENKCARMRNDYEARLAELSDSKRQAMRELNKKYDSKLEEKDLLLLEVQEQADLENREHNTITSAIEEDADREIQELKIAFSAQLKEEKDANVRLKGEIGLMKKKLIAARKEIEEFKHSIKQLKAEHKQFQKVISGLEKEIIDLKKEIGERDITIQEKEKRIFELKRKTSELEKYKFVLSYRIMELKNQIEPLERQIKASKARTIELEESLEYLLKSKAFRELKIQGIEEKIREAKQVFGNEIEKSIALKSILKKIKIDLHDMTADFQDPVKLRQSVKSLFKKYTEDVDFLRNRKSDQDAIMEFYRQRQFLEQQIELTKHQLQKAYTMSKNDINKILDENCALLTELNTLRTELKATRTRCFQMESILGLSARYVPPAIAREKLDYVTEDRQRLAQKYREKYREKQNLIVSLKEENQRILNKISQAEASESFPEGIEPESGEGGGGAATEGGEGAPVGQGGDGGAGADITAGGDIISRPSTSAD